MGLEGIRDMIKLSGMYSVHKIKDLSSALGKIAYFWPEK